MVDPKFSSAINIILVAFYARDAALPCPYTDREWLENFLYFFNSAAKRYSSQASQIHLLPFTLKRGYDGKIITHDLIIRFSNLMSYDTRSHWNDEQLGRYLGMDDVNIKNFLTNLNCAFEAVEVYTGVAIFHELIARSFMTRKKYEEFCSQCGKMVQRWNEVMVMLNLKYRFEAKIGPIVHG